MKNQNFFLSLFLVGMTTSLIAFPMDGLEEYSSTITSLTLARERERDVDMVADAGAGNSALQKRGSTLTAREDESDATSAPNVSAAGKPPSTTEFVDEGQLEENTTQHVTRKASFYAARKADALSEAAFFDGRYKSEISDDSSEPLSQRDGYTRLARAIHNLRWKWNVLILGTDKLKETLDYLDDQSVRYSPSVDDNGPWEKVLAQLESANTSFSNLEENQSEINRLGYREFCSSDYSLTEGAISKIQSAYNLVQSLDKRERYAQEARLSKNPIHTDFWNKAAEHAQAAVLYNSQAIDEARSSGIEITHSDYYYLAEEAISIADQYVSLIDYSKKIALARSSEDHQIADCLERVAEQTQTVINCKLQVAELKKSQEQLPKESFWLIDIDWTAKSHAKIILEEIDYLTRLRVSSDPAIRLYLNCALKITQNIEQHYAQAVSLFASHEKEEADKLKKKAHAAEREIIGYNLYANRLEEAAQRNKQELPQHDVMLADYLEKTTQASASGKYNFATLWTKATEQTQAVMGYVSRGLEAFEKGEEFIHFADAALSATSARELIVEVIALLTHASASTDPAIKIYWNRTLDKIKVTTDLYTEAAEAHVEQLPEEAEKLRKEARTVASRAKEYARGRAVPPNLKKSTQSAKVVDRLAVVAHSGEISSASQRATDSTADPSSDLAMDPSAAAQQKEATKKKIGFADAEEK